VDLEEFIVTVFVLIDDLLTEVQTGPGASRVRRHGPPPRLHDSEVLTMEVVGEFLGHDTDVALYTYFCRHHATLFPVLPTVHRTTFARQAANLWALKERLWGMVLERLPHDPTLALIDSLPVPVCRFAHGPGCRRFRGQAAHGYDRSSRCVYYGLRGHLRVAWPGVVTALSVAPANIHDQDLVPELVDGTVGGVIGDRNYWNPRLTAALAPAGITLLAPFRMRTTDPTPTRSRLLNRVRRRIETTAGQLVERYHLKRIWARDAWHLTSRVLRKVLSHTIAVLLNVARGCPEPLQLARLLA
jgi:Transposase DDE domain